MTSPYTGAAALAREAAIIAQNALHMAPGIPPLIVLTDPARLPDPIALATHLPKGCAIIYRHFGDPDARKISKEASTICAKRGLVFLVSCATDVPPGPGMGVHFPQKMHDAIPDWRKGYPTCIFTAAAHDTKSAKRALALGANAVLLSPVFDSNSPSAGAALGADKVAHMSKNIPGPVYALGGVTVQNAQCLSGHAAGLAVVSGII